MDPVQTSVFISILFYLTNVISGASLGNVELFNGTFDNAEEQHRIVLQNIQKNYANEFRNYEMADIENFVSDFMTPVKKEKKPIYTSKTFFGSDQFFGDHHRSKDNSHHQTWDPFRANRVVGSQPSYFDVSDDLFQEYIYGTNNHEPSYTKIEDKASDFSRAIAGTLKNEDKFPSSEVISFKDEENDFSSSKDDESSKDHLYEIFPVDGTKDQVDAISHPDGDEVDELSNPVDLSHPVEDDIEDADQSSFPVDDDAEDVDQPLLPIDDDAKDRMDELSHPEGNVGADDQGNERSNSIDDDMDELSHPVEDDNEYVDEISHPEDDDAKDEVDELDELSHPVYDEVDDLSNSVDDAKNQDVLSHQLGEDGKFQVNEVSLPLEETQDQANELSQPIDENTEDHVDELSRSIDVSEDEDEFSHPVDDDAKGEEDEFSHPVDDDAKDEEDEFSHPVDDDAKDEEDEFSHPVDDDAKDEEDEFSRPVDGDENQNERFRTVDENGNDQISHAIDKAIDQVDELSRPEGDMDANDKVNEPSNSVDVEEKVGTSSHPVGEPQSQESDLTPTVDGIQDQVDERIHPIDKAQSKVDEISPSVDGTQTQVDELSISEENVLDSKDFDVDEVTTEKVFIRLSHSTMAGVDDELDDSTENQENKFIQSVDVFKSWEDELISTDDDVIDSEFFRLDKLNATKVTNLRGLNMTVTKNPILENPKNDADIVLLDEQNRNASSFEKIPDEHVEKVQSVGDFNSTEFEEKSFDKPLIKDLDFSKFDIDEFQGSGDMEDSLNGLADSLFDSKSGRIIDIFPRVNNTAECTTPKGERGRCRSLAQCPLSDPLSNFNLFLQYVCLSRGVLIGICCPDNPVVEISDPTENSTGTNVTEFKQPADGCGLNTNTRIVGGKVSFPHEWTWMVALLRRNRFFCGGVIINDWYILTAAHCVMGVKLKDLKVRLGEYNFNEKNEHQEDIPVAEIKRHALFVTLTFQHDIALLKLKRRIEYTKFIGSICLPNPKSGNFSNVNATVVGWGTVAFGGSASPVLRQVTVPVWDNDDCDKTYRMERITDAFMCAGSPENGEDACQGDSGGPLMTLGEEGRWEVIGIVSWGRRCGDPTFPGVYTRVTSYLDWIAENAS